MQFAIFRLGHSDSIRGADYEWVRTLETARGFIAEHAELAEPPGFRL